jgi:hypothetical protein
MTVKLLEIRDRATCIPAMAVSIEGADGYIARRAGFESRMIYVVMLATEKARYDPYHWDNPRTMGNAHAYIQEHFDELQDGQVIDVEFILGETAISKISEAVTHPL